MDQLTTNAAALVAALAHDHGINGLAPDADGLIPIDFEGETVVLIFATAWDSVFITAVLATDAQAALDDAFRPFRIGARLASRNTRIGRDEESGALVLTREIGLVGLSYPAFNSALAAYLEDLALVRRELRLASAPSWR